MKLAQNNYYFETDTTFSTSHDFKITQLPTNLILLYLENQLLMFANLKDIAGVCEIEKELTFHIARHIFVTTVTLTNGVPHDSVSKMLGHKNLRTTQHYAKVLDRKNE